MGPIRMKVSMKSTIVWGILLIFYASLIFTLSSLPLSSKDVPLAKPFLNRDKLLHGLEFCIFFLLCWKVLPRHRVLGALAMVGVYAGSDELHQLFVVGRAACIFDWLADVGGGIVGAFLVCLWIAFCRVKIAARRKEEG